VIVDQHFVRRERHNRLLAVVLERPTLLGAGIDESTALEIGPDGTWTVRIHLLPPGSTLDPATGRFSLPR
jgi:cyanophycinase